jgi:hypothetical protein
MPYVWCNLSQSPTHCHLWHAIGGHGCSMCVVVEVEWCYVWAHQCQTQFHGFHGVIMHNKLEDNENTLNKLGHLNFMCCKLRKM